MLNILTADLQADDTFAVITLLRIDVEDGDLHIGKRHGDIGKHTNSVIGKELKESLVNTSVIGLLCFFPMSFPCPTPNFAPWYPTVWKTH